MRCTQFCDSGGIRGLIEVLRLFENRDLTVTSLSSSESAGNFVEIDPLAPSGVSAAELQPSFYFVSS